MDKSIFNDAFHVFCRSFNTTIDKYEQLYDNIFFAKVSIVDSLMDKFRIVCSIKLFGNTQKLDVYPESCCYAAHEQGTKAAEMLISLAILDKK